MTSVRKLAARDVDTVQAMVRDFGAYLTALGDSWQHNFTAARYLEDGFGPNPAFHGLIAEDEGGPLGYLLLSPSYDVDRGIRIEIVVDLWVNERSRGRGVGKALMKEAAELARTRGARQLLWAVFKPNKLAADFYRGIGGKMVDDLDWMYLPLE
ncbi:MAG: GNAT family N-acetyltransferase [Rhodospirillaceae bacterium]|nr:GNAT family N-acetyltransferase [Rhodospirillaceae bacterium]